MPGGCAHLFGAIIAPVTQKSVRRSRRSTDNSHACVERRVAGYIVRPSGFNRPEFSNVGLNNDRHYGNIPAGRPTLQQHHVLLACPFGNAASYQRLVRSGPFCDCCGDTSTSSKTGHPHAFKSAGWNNRPIHIASTHLECFIRCSVLSTPGFDKLFLQQSRDGPVRSEFNVAASEWSV